MPCSMSWHKTRTLVTTPGFKDRWLGLGHTVVLNHPSTMSPHFNQTEFSPPTNTGLSSPKSSTSGKEGLDRAAQFSRALGAPSIVQGQALLPEVPDQSPQAFHGHPHKRLQVSAPSRPTRLKTVSSVMKEVSTHGATAPYPKFSRCKFWKIFTSVDEYFFKTT